MLYAPVPFQPQIIRARMTLGAKSMEYGGRTEPLETNIEAA